MIVNQTEQLLTIIYFTKESFICQRFSLQGVLHDSTKLDVDVPTNRRAPEIQVFRGAIPTDYCGNYRLPLFVNIHAQNERNASTINALRNQSWCQTLRLKRPDQKLVVDKVWDFLPAMATRTKWKGVDYSLVQRDEGNELLLKISQEGVDDLLVELRNDSQCHWVSSTLPRSAWVGSSLTADPGFSSQILGNEMYIVILKAGRLHVLYFDPDAETGPDHIHF
jgi:hypothetical protein